MGDPLGEKIRGLRIQLKMTQAELAGDDFTKSFISQVEKGQTRPSLRSLRLIASRLDKPVSYFLSEDDEFKEAPNLPPEFNSLVATARSYLFNNRLEESDQTFREALALCSNHHSEKRGEILAELGRIQLKKGAYDQALSEFVLAIEELNKSLPTEQYVRCLTDMGSAYFYLHKLTQAKNAFQSALKAFDEVRLSNINLQLTIRSEYGNVLARLGDYQDAITVLDEALNISRNDGEYYLFGKLCHILGVCYDASGMFSLAIQATDRARQFFTIVENTYLQMLCQVNLAMHYRKSGDAKRAQEVVSDVMQNPSASLYPDILAAAHVEAALLYMEKKNPEAAISEMQIAVDLSTNQETLPKWAGIVAQCAGKAPIPSSILQALEKATFHWRGDSHGLAEMHSRLGEIYTTLHNPIKANQHLTRSVALYRDFHS